jgi:hypothetical protein
MIMLKRMHSYVEHVLEPPTVITITTSAHLNAILSLCGNTCPQKSVFESELERKQKQISKQGLVLQHEKKEKELLVDQLSRAKTKIGVRDSTLSAVRKTLVAELIRLKEEVSIDLVVYRVILCYCLP